MSAVRSRVLMLLIALVFVSHPSHAVLAQSYILIDLGTLGGNYSVATGVNDQGQVCGYSSLPPNNFPTHAFLWSGTMIDLGVLGGYFSYAEAVNNLGQVVGKSNGEGFLWENGVMMDMDTPYGQSSEANDINILAQITGRKNSHAYIWEDGDWDMLEVWPACSWSVGYGINDSGQVAGSISCSQTSRAVLWDNGKAINLGVYPGDYHSWAYDINNQSQIVGASRDVPGNHAVLWDGEEIIDLGVGDGSLSQALAINDAGQIVGWFGDGYENYTHRAFFWEDGVMTDLNELIPEDAGLLLKEAYDINLSGQIVGWGLNSEGFGHAFLLDPCIGADLDCDGSVGAADLAQLLGNWGPCPEPCTPGDPAQTCPADFDGDCAVEAFDLAILLGSWGP